MNGIVGADEAGDDAIDAKRSIDRLSVVRQGQGPVDADGRGCAFLSWWALQGHAVPLRASATTVRATSRWAASPLSVPISCRMRSPDFESSTPKIAVSLTVAASSAVRDMVAAGRLDIAITADEVVTTGLESVPFAKFPAALAIPPRHPLAQKNVVVPADLDRVDFVALAPEDTTRHEAEAIFAQHGAAPKVVVETAYASVVCALVLVGTGCGIVDPVTATLYVEQGLVLCPLEPCPNFRTLMLFPPRKASRIVAEMAKALTLEAQQATRRS